MNKRIAYSVTTPYLFILPAILFFAVFSYMPIVESFLLSFRKWDMLRIQKPFIGLKNYLTIFKDKVFWTSLRNTLYFMVVLTTMSTALSLAIAVGIGGIKGLAKSFIRICFYIPIVSSMVAVCFFWRILYDTNYGIFNLILGKVGLPTVGWLTDPKNTLNSIIIMSLWKSLGYNIIIFLAGLDSIPDTYYEAARIDGSNRATTFLRITLPLLRPTTLFVVVTTVISALQVFTEVYSLTGLAFGMHNIGGPGHASRVLVLYIYQTAFTSLNMGKGAAMAVALFFIILAFTVVQLRLFRGKED
jgi:multiple sugar transport system permease protein